MKLRKVTESRFKANPPVCEKCDKTVPVGEEFYVVEPSKIKYCKPCGDKLYQ